MKKMRALFAMVAAIGFVVCGSALAATRHGTKADARALTKAIQQYPHFGCYRPVGYERLVDIRVSNNQRERGIDFVAEAYQRAPKDAQGCEIIFEHHEHGHWQVLSYGSSPCDTGSRQLKAACKVFYPRS